MEKKLFPYVSEKDGFVFLNGKLQEVRIKSQTIIRTNGEWKISLVANTGDEEIEISSDELYECGVAYQNKDSVINKIQSFGVLGVNEDGTYYTNENGQVSIHVLEPIHISVKLSEFGQHIFSCPEIENLRAKNVQFYRSRSVAEQMCEITARSIDGKEYPMKGILRKIMLTDEQRKAVEEFKAAYVKAEKLGVGYVYDMEYNVLRIFNKKNLTDYTTMYQGDLNEDDEWLVPEIFENEVKNDFILPGVRFGLLTYDSILAVKDE